MADDAGTAGPAGAAKAIADSKALLARGSKLTQSVEGNSTSSFAPKKPEAPKVPQAHSKPSYSLVKQARDTGEDVNKGLQDKQSNVQQYLDATKNQ